MGEKTKRIFMGMLSVILSLALVTGNGIVTATLSADAAQDTQFQVKIVHTNDIHARVEGNEKGGIIGMAKLKGLVNQFTAGADMKFVLDSGDLFHGQSIATVSKGESVSQLVKECGYDAMTVGNHDWNYGSERLKELCETAKIQMLVGNVQTKDGNAFFDQEYLTKEVTKDGKTLKIGVFGVIDPKLYNYTAPACLEGITYTDSVSYAKKAAGELKELGCDIVIALAHTLQPVELAKQVDGVNLWLAGHEHMNVNEKVTTPDGSSSYVVEDGYYLYNAGTIEMDVTLDDAGEVKNVSCDSKTISYEDVKEVPADEKVTAKLAEINEQQKTILNRKVGESPVDLEGGWEALRIDETTLGRVITDAYLAETGADIAFENAGGIRATVKKGDVTYGDIISVSPYGNYVVTKQITGADVKDILETSVDIQMKNIEANDSGDYDAWPNNSGSYLQVGGLCAQYNFSAPKGKRVDRITIGGRPVEETKLYTVATNNYAATSNDYPALKAAEEVGEFRSCDEILISYFQKDAATITRSAELSRMIRLVPADKPTEPTTTQPTTEPTTTQLVTTEPTTTQPATTATEPTTEPTTTQQPAVKVVKKKQNIKVAVKKASIKMSKIKKKNILLKKLIVTKNAKGTVSYTKIRKGSSKKLAISKMTGNITVKKGTKKGTYTIRVKVTAMATTKYLQSSKTVTLKIKVK